MSEHHPRIRILAQNGHVLIREGLSLCFYMRHPHDAVKHAVMRSLESYLRGVGPRTLGLYATAEGEWQELDAASWKLTRNRLLEEPWPSISLRDDSPGECQYLFDYLGKPLGDPSLGDEPDAVCALRFWLPTEYLEAQGPSQVRELVLELAAPLPFCSGHAGLAFNCQPDLLGVTREIRERCFRYPGLDIPDFERLSWNIGTRVRGPAWLTFLGHPVLNELGGAAGLRSRLHSPDTTVQELEGERAVVTLGPWPEAGDTEQGNPLPAYRELARVLEPWLYRETHLRVSDEFRRWERRFLG